MGNRTDTRVATIAVVRLPSSEPEGQISPEFIWARAGPVDLTVAASIPRRDGQWLSLAICCPETEWQKNRKRSIRLYRTNPKANAG